jgi:hypothetical protein
VEYFLFSQLTETDLDDIALSIGGRRFTNDHKIEEMNGDYVLDGAVFAT